MSATEFHAVLPLIVLALTSLLAVVHIAVVRHHTSVAVLTMLGLGVSFASLWVASPVAPIVVTPLLVIDRFALFYTGLVTAGALGVAAVMYGSLRGPREQAEESYVLLALATLGSAVMVSSRHFASLFLGLELLSVPLYALIAYRYARSPAVEAGLKYLILAAASAACLLFGIALIYVEAGTLELPSLAERLGAQELSTPWVLAGFGLVWVGLGLELAAAPFYQWAPDVYQGAPAPITGFIATVSKVAVLGLLVRYLSAIQVQGHQPMLYLIGFMAVASMFIGNLAALFQANLKRLLAYSSIAHVGYLLVGLVAAGPLAAEAVTFYLVGYVVTTLAAFAVITFVSTGDAELELVNDYRGLAWRNPWLAALLVTAMLSLAGLPLTAGFLGKYYLVIAGVERTRYGLVVVLLVNSVIGLYYYLRVVSMVFAHTEQSSAEASPLRLPAGTWIGSVAAAVFWILVIWLGVAPSTFIDPIQAAVASLG